MDDINIHEICLDNLNTEEIQLDEDEDNWIKLSWTDNQSDNRNVQSSKTQKDSDNEMAETKDYDSKISCINTELEDVSDGISIITESDTDVNTNLQICQFNHKPYKSPQMLKKDIWNILIAFIIGIIIGGTSTYFFIITIRETCPVSSGVDAESLKTASRNIVNTCKELTDVKIMLNEIKTHMPTDKKITKQILTQFFEITDSSNKTNSKPVMITKKFFNSASHPLDQLQMSLHVLSSLTFIDNNNNSLKNDINKTLDIVNSTQAFYDILTFNDTQDVFEPIVLNFLQQNSDKMYITSKSLLSNLVEKVSKATLKIYNKYVKEGHKLNKKLCHLKSIISDDKPLKQLTKNNQLFKDYDKSCFSNYTSKKLDKKMTKENAKIKHAEHVIKTDDTVLYTKYDKRNAQKIHDYNKEDSLKNKRNNRQYVDKSTTMKFLRNTSHQIHNTSQLLFSKVIESVNKLRQINQLSKKLHQLKDLLPNNEILKQLIEDDEENNKKSIKCYEGKNDLQSNMILKNSFDNILMQLKNTCPLSTNSCPKFNINMTTFDSMVNYKNKNYKHKKYDTNNKKTVMNHENSAKILPAEGKNRPKKKEHFKSNDSTQKVINDKISYEEKNIPSQNKIKNHISENANYHTTKHSSFDSRTIKQDNQYYTNKKSDNVYERSYKYNKQQQPDNSDWYFRRVYSRRNARRHAKYMYH